MFKKQEQLIFNLCLPNAVSKSQRHTALDTDRHRLKICYFCFQTSDSWMDNDSVPAIQTKRAVMHHHIQCLVLIGLAWSLNHIKMMCFFNDSTRYISSNQHLKVNQSIGFRMLRVSASTGKSQQEDPHQAAETGSLYLQVATGRLLRATCFVFVVVVVFNKLYHLSEPVVSLLHILFYNGAPYHGPLLMILSTSLTKMQYSFNCIIGVWDLFGQPE